MSGSSRIEWTERTDAGAGGVMRAALARLRTIFRTPLRDEVERLQRDRERLDALVLELRREVEGLKRDRQPRRASKPHPDRGRVRRDEKFLA